MSTPQGAGVAPAKVERARGALARYRVMAWVTGVVLATMTIAWVVFKGILGNPSPGTWYSIGWIAHGWLFVVYLVTAVDLATRVRWRPLPTLLVMVAGTIPFASFVAEHWATKDVRARLADAPRV